MWPFKKKETKKEKYSLGVNQRVVIEEKKEDIECETFYFLIHFTPQMTYVYMADDEFEEDEATMYIYDKDDKIYRFSGNFVCLEENVRISKEETIKEVLKLYELESENGRNPYKVIEIKTDF
ncbi:hypothetical protein [Bacillus sp. NPDC094106]|uniref:hypothetical protein n=1 Tax=Bacillus sp. NPDC094106 TaxID=3363949 RepID=UPI0038056EC8